MKCKDCIYCGYIRMYIRYVSYCAVYHVVVDAEEEDACDEFEAEP